MGYDRNPEYVINPLHQNMSQVHILINDYHVGTLIGCRYSPRESKYKSWNLFVHIKWDNQTEPMEKFQDRSMRECTAICLGYWIHEQCVEIPF